MIKLKFDTTVEFSVGSDRNSTNWAAKKQPWSRFILKLQETHRTAERYKDYLDFPKSQQDKIKDIGGFVGGVLSGGRRKKNAVLYRTMLTFDLDDMTREEGAALVFNFELMYGCAAVFYTTHKHCTERPRWRVIIPLADPCTPEEYPAIARRIAGNVGIEMFDPSCFRVHQLMYWPSTAQDGEYGFHIIDGPILDARKVLREYIGPEGWKDISQWPHNQREREARQRGTGLLGDPLEKPGLIGAWCRCFSMCDAIERFLPDVYERAAVGEGDRYTYLHGSTAGGLVVYEDKFAYSHHGTDPAEGRVWNAFDLVRIHKFGALDAETGPETPLTARPSHKAMLDYVSLNSEVRGLLAKERIAAAGEAYKDVYLGDEPGEYMVQDDERGPQITLGELQRIDREGAEPLGDEDNAEWLKELDVDRKTGQIKGTIPNCVLILENDPGLKGRFLLDDFKQQEIVQGKLPWRRVTPSTQWLTDRDEAALRFHLEKVYGITGVQKIRDAVDTVMIRNTIHPVKKYLQKLVWDGVYRLETVLIDYLGAEDTLYVRTVTRKQFLAAVTRIMRPGIKYDNMLVTVGPEGMKKSLLIDKMGGEWFSDTFHTVQGKEAYEQLQGAWLIEVAELAGLRKAEREQVKHFLSKRMDQYRPAFGRKMLWRPRQCVFFGTTNKDKFLEGDDGNRRFWPVYIAVNPPTRDVVTMTREEIGQLWAEAMEWYRAGESLHLDPEMVKVAKKAQQDHTRQDDRIGRLIDYLDLRVPDNWYELGVWDRRAYITGMSKVEDESEGFIRDRITTTEIVEELYKLDFKDWDRRRSEELYSMLNQVPGWEKAKNPFRVKGMQGTHKGYMRKVNVG